MGRGRKLQSPESPHLIRLIYHPRPDSYRIDLGLVRKIAYNVRTYESLKVTAGIHLSDMNLLSAVILSIENTRGEEGGSESLQKPTIVSFYCVKMAFRVTSFKLP